MEGKRHEGSGGEGAGARSCVRPARPGDETLLGRLHVATWRATYRGTIPDGILAGLREEERAARWRRVLEEGMAAVWIAELDGRGVGFASVGPSRDGDEEGEGGRGSRPLLGEIRTLYLLPEAQGRGLGVALWTAATARLARDGFAEGALWALEANARARAFYERRGWRADGWTKTERLGAALLDHVRYRGPLTPAGRPKRA